MKTFNLVDDNRRNPVVLFYNQFFDHFPKTSGLACEDSVIFTTRRRALASADVVIFHLPGMADFSGIPKYPRNLWTVWCKEPASNYPALLDPDFNAKFDFRMTYMRNAEVWVSYILPPEAYDALRNTELPAKTRDALAMFMVSSEYDRSGRLSFAAELMRQIPVHSYGRQLHNRDIEGEDRGRATKLALLARYKFSLAFENSIHEDYVTEKFFQPLAVGTIPVYLGAPNVADFAPGPRSYIDVRDFRDPRELGDYLKYLDQNDAAFAEYFTWRHAPARSFLDILEETVIRHPLCRLGELARRRNVTSGRPPIGGRPVFPFGGAESPSKGLLRVGSEVSRKIGRIVLGPAAWN